MSTTVNCPNCSANINTCAGEGCCNKNNWSWTSEKEDKSVSPITTQPTNKCWTETETKKKDESTQTGPTYNCWGGWNNVSEV